MTHLRNILSVLAVIFILIVVSPGFPQNQTTNTTTTDALQTLSDALNKNTPQDEPIKVEVFDFMGRLVNYGSSLLLKQNDFWAIQNFRYFENGIGTRLGTANWTVNADPGGSNIVKMLYFPSETDPHLIAASADTTGITYHQIENRSFGAGVSLWRTTGVTTTTKITSAFVRDTLLVADAGGVTVWSGNSAFPTALLEQASGTTDYIDRTYWVYDKEQHTVAAGNTVYVGYSRAFNKVQADKDVAMYDHLSSVTEAMYGGLMRYWASWQVGGGGSTFESPKIETRPRALGTDWDGQTWVFAQQAVFQKTGISPYQDYSLFIQNNSQEEVMDVSEWESGGTITYGFRQRPRQIYVYLPEEYKNKNAATITAYYYNGSPSLAAVPGFTDGTAKGGVALAQSGVYDFDKITNWERRKIGESKFDYYPFYLKTSATISNYVKIYKVVAIPDYDSPTTARGGGYRGVASGLKRAWLFNGNDLSRVLCSAENQPDVFIGPDTFSNDDPLIVGKREKTMWAGGFGKSILFMKETENWITEGANPSVMRASLKHLSGTAPCVAPDSFVVIEKDGGIAGLYLSRDGVYAIDSAGNNVCLSLDIRAYFETGNTLEIPATQLYHSTGWYDPVNLEYHLLTKNGTLELVYDIKNKKWTTFDRGSAARIVSGAFLVDKNQNRFHLGGGAGGTVFQLESGTSDYGSAIISDLTRPAIVLGGRMNRKSELVNFVIKYDLPDGAAISGCSLYLTPSSNSSTTGYQTALQDTTGTSLGTSGAAWVNLNAFRPYTKGFHHKFQMRFPGRVNLHQEIVGSKEASWAH